MYCHILCKLELGCMGKQLFLQIPAGYICSTVLVAGNNVTDSMMQFGNFLKTFYKKDESYRKSDFTINYIGSAPLCIPQGQGMYVRCRLMVYDLLHMLL